MNIGLDTPREMWQESVSTLGEVIHTMRSPLEDEGFVFHQSGVDQVDDWIHSNSLTSYLIFVAVVAVVAFILVH